MPEDLAKFEADVLEILREGELKGTVLKDRIDRKLGREIRRTFFYTTLAQMAEAGKIVHRKQNTAWKKVAFYKLAEPTVAKKKAKK